MIGVELFAGVGGMSLGASNAGVKVKLAVEIDANATRTFAFNHAGCNVVNSDIRKVKSIDIKKQKEPTILFGGPPCQGFSLSNQKTRNKQNVNNWLFKDFIRLTKSWMPDWVLIENVSGLLKTENGYFIDLIIKQLNKLGYTTSYKLLNSRDFGVPQKRERVFIVGSLHGTNMNFPSPESKKIVTVEEAINDLPQLNNGDNREKLDYKTKAISSYSKKMRKGVRYAHNNNVTRNNDLVIKRYSYIPPGGNWEDIPTKLLKNYTDYSRCHGGIYHRLKMDEPSVVIGNYRKNMLIHPIENRGLSVREAARLQSFPDNFKFLGGLTDKQQHVGNAVPPLLAEIVFKTIIKHN